MSGMGDDFNDSPESGVMPAHPAEQHAQYRAACAELMRQRDAVISTAAVRAMQDAARMFDATQGRQQAEHTPLTDAQVGAACLAYRHDYGLLPPHAKVRIAAECRQWDEALKKARHPLADAFAGAMAALDAPAAPLLRDLGDAVLRAGGADSEGVEP